MLLCNVLVYCNNVNDILYAFKEGAQTALFEDPVRTAL